MDKIIRIKEKDSANLHYKIILGLIEVKVLLTMDHDMKLSISKIDMESIFICNTMKEILEKRYIVL